MENQEMNIRMVLTLNEWDPFELGFGNYEPEIADVVQAVYTSDDAKTLAFKIQEVYAFSFEKTIPIEKCSAIATQLLIIKNAGSCSL
jgi:hypothetical protein